MKRYFVDVIYDGNVASSEVIGFFDKLFEAKDFIWEEFEGLPPDRDFVAKFRVINTKRNIVVYDYDGDDGDRGEFYGYSAERAK